jgi:hypothetical protein
MVAVSVRAADLDWAVGVLGKRRTSLVAFAPVFWRPANNALERHRDYLQQLLSQDGARAFRTDDALLVANPESGRWLVDDLYVPESGWGSSAQDLWNGLDVVAHERPVRFVCPTYERDRSDFARAAGLTVSESWWLRELPESGGGSAGAQLDLAGTRAVTVAAPPVYDPGGPVLFIPSLSCTGRELPMTEEAARRHGCSAIVVVQQAGDTSHSERLHAAGLRRHCDYYGGVIRPLA